MLTRFARNRIILLLYCLSQTVLFAQNKQIDSLLSVLKTAKDDTSKVNTLNALSKQLLQTRNYSDVKKYAEEALSLAEKNDFKNGIAEAYNNLGVCYFYQGDSSKAMTNYLACLKVREQIGDQQGIAKSYHNIALVYHNQDNYPEAIKNYFASLKAREKTGDKDGMAKTYGNVGLIYWQQNNYSEALKNQFSALQLFKDINNKIGIAGTYNNIGLVYKDQGNSSEALKYHSDAIKIYEELGDKGSLIDLYFNIGFLYEAQANYSEALKNYQVALKICEEIGNNDAIAVSYNNIGNLYYKQGIAEPNLKQREQLLNDALNNYLNSHDRFKELDDREGLGGCYNGMGGVFLELKNYSKAKQFLNDGLTLSKENGLISDIKESYRLLAKLDSTTGYWKEAFRNQKLYILYRDSLVNEESSRKVMKAQMQFDFDKKEDSLNFRQALTNERYEKQKQAKNYLIVGLVLFVILSFFIYRNFRNRNLLKLQVLRNKIASDLHDDVGSTLSSISIFSQMAQEQSKEVIPLLETIGESSRKMLDAMADIVWTIKPENDQFEKIIFRMRNFAYELLGAKKIDFEFVADDNVAQMKLPMEVRKNLYLIFKEATNNMVKYAGANKAMFAIREEKNNLTMLIRDNGKGFDTSHATNGNGIKNMRKRADEIKGQLLIESSLGIGTTIQLNVVV